MKRPRVLTRPETVRALVRLDYNTRNCSVLQDTVDCILTVAGTTRLRPRWEAPATTAALTHTELRVQPQRRLGQRPV